MNRKLLIITNDIAKSGTNRVIADIVRELQQDFSIALLPLQGGNNAYDYPEIRIFSLKSKHTGNKVGRMLHTFATVPGIGKIIKIEKPDAVMSFLPRANIANVLSKIAFRSMYKCIICERNFNSIQYGKTLQGRLFKELMKATYPHSDIVIGNAKELAVDLEKSFRVPRSKLRVIYNPFDLQRIKKLSLEKVDTPSWFNACVPVFLNVARLIEQKNHDLLLRAFARVRKKTKCRLVIMGEGPLKEKLYNTVGLMGVRDDVLFLGWQDNPFKYMGKARGFILSSEYEGFPNVLVEAMICGCPIISTSCRSGPREILGNGAFGLLVPVGDELALAEAMQKFIEKEELVSELSQRGKERAKEFELRLVAAQFRNVLCG